MLAHAAELREFVRSVVPSVTTVSFHMPEPELPALDFYQTFPFRLCLLHQLSVLFGFVYPYRNERGVFTIVPHENRIWLFLRPPQSVDNRHQFCHIVRQSFCALVPDMCGAALLPRGQTCRPYAPDRRRP